MSLGSIAYAKARSIFGKSKFSGLNAQEIQRAIFEDENRRLRQTIARLMVERDVLKGIAGRNQLNRPA
jgi:hypothetical protein